MLCVYGVVRETHPGVGETAGVQRGPVTVVRHGALGALVSAVPDDDEMLARRRDVTAFMNVLDIAAARGDVLPFRFGTVVAGEAELRAALEDRAAEYLAMLDELGGLVQMTLKAVRSDDEAVRAAVGADPALRRWVADRAGSQALTDRLAVGERVAAAVAELTEHDAADIVARVSPVAHAVVADDAAPPTVVALSLLMEPDALPRLDDVVARLHDDYGTRMTIDYAGPMPPYSFVRR